jgi:hypothetical protein
LRKNSIQINFGPMPSDPHPSLADRTQSRDPEELLAVASDLDLTEDMALALLARRDLPGPVIEAIGKNPALLKHRKVILAVASHTRAPRHVSLPLTRHLYTFELVKIALLPAVPADVKVGIDEIIISRLAQISEGERLTLAKRASGRVAGALLLDAQERIVAAALNNPRMTEDVLLRALAQRRASERLVRLVCRHRQWSLRRDIRLSLLRNEHTPLAEAIVFAGEFPVQLVREVLSQSKLQPAIKKYLLVLLEARAAEKKES